MPRRSFVMKLSDLVTLREGIFQLEKGHTDRSPERCESVVLLFAGSETQLTTQKFEKDDEVL